MMTPQSWVWLAAQFTGLLATSCTLQISDFIFDVETVQIIWIHEKSDIYQPEAQI